ncbi:MAG: hypothetical protein GF388_11855 [Candidatus Aegiribacteria sp.]|nr:hypothetical protein [Candidatus Aegiribacteria sp.]MBD3295662.1 hypothetical protein [Candidatus Fermentibacteria bacterium]
MKLPGKAVLAGPGSSLSRSNLTTPLSPVQKACRSAIAEELESLRRFRKNGGLVLGFLCSGFPEALAAGLGFRPLRLISGYTDDAMNKGVMRLRPDVCPMILSFLGGVLDGTEPFSLVDLWIGLSTCDQTRRCFSLLEDSESVFTVHLPATRTDAAGKYYAGQLEDFVARAGSITGMSYSESRALRYVHEKATAAALLRKAVASGAISPLDIHWMLHLYHVSDPSGLEERIGSILELAGEYRPRLITGISGSPMVSEDVHALRAIQDNGAGVVPLGCTGLLPLQRMEAAADSACADPVSLALSSFESLRCPRSRPNDQLFSYLNGSLEQYGCAGLIIKCLKFCDLWYAERQRFKDRIQLPVMVMDTSYGPGEALRQQGRIDAFLETLEE